MGQTRESSVGVTNLLYSKTTGNPLVSLTD
jgi:hypothetical protein